MASYTLLIYEMVPEETKLYLIPNNRLDAEEIGFLRQAHGKFINADEENEGMRFLNAACASRTEHCEDGTPLDWMCCYNEYLVNKNDEDFPPIEMDDSITRVILTGFIL